MKTLLRCSTVDLSWKMKESANLKTHDGNYVIQRIEREKDEEKLVESNKCRASFNKPTYM